MRDFSCRIAAVAALVWLAGAGVLRAADPVVLAVPDQPRAGWVFGNGQEFPGATGDLAVDADAKVQGQPALRLTGDFSAGGQYVQAKFDLPEGDLERLTLWLKAPNQERFTIRVSDRAGTCHQIRLKLTPSADFQQVDFPFAEYFRRMGTPDAITTVAGYEKWEVAKDRGWFGGATQLCLLTGRHAADPATKKAVMWFGDVRVVMREKPAAIKKTVRLDDFLQAGEVDWGFTNGQEFPGAKGKLELVKDQPEAGKNALLLSGDFTGGGAYVATTKSLKTLEAIATETIRFRVKSDNVTSFSFRMGDGTDQWLQKKGFKVVPDGKWQEIVIKPAEFAGAEHWGGANDGAWHEPCTAFSLVIGGGSAPGSKTPALLIADATADIYVAAAVQPAAFSETFEAVAPPALPAQWAKAGDVTVQDNAGCESKRALVLNRPLAAIDTPCNATSLSFAAAPGMWRLTGAARSELNSPDNSYQGAVRLEFLNAAGAVVASPEGAILTGKTDWQKFEKLVEAPTGTAVARVRAELNKTHGVLTVDTLAASFLVQTQKRIYRISAKSDAVGNLFLPDAKRVFHLRVESFVPLAETARQLTWVVRDYWGAEVAAPAALTLDKGQRTKEHFVYTAELDLAALPLAVGTFYELHLEVANEGGEPTQDFRGLAILPLAPAKQYRPDQIPFTSRNWDNRVKEYFFLSDRIGLRIIGLWAGWAATPPYKTSAPGIEFTKELGASWHCGSPVSAIERHGAGYEKLTPESLRDGAKQFVTEYKDRGLVAMCMGNEPHGDYERVQENVAGYQAVYEGIKASGAPVQVIGTAVGPEEDYFKAGFQRYQDVYDFHVYEHYSSVRHSFRKYRELFAKYPDSAKPIVSTELGLNSQGQTRRAVAIELYKKITCFFAEGGLHASWFGICYPDSKGQARGTFGDAHNTFDCRFNEYNARLDAVAYYNMVNGLLIKKFVAEKQYPDSTQAFLFRDEKNECLLVVWNDKGPRPVWLPLPGVAAVKVTRLDGSLGELDAKAAGGVTLQVSDEPLLLQFAGADLKLADALGAPRLAVEGAPKDIARGQPVALTIAGDKLTVADLEVVAPPRWQAVLTTLTPGKVTVALTPPAATAARELRVLVRHRLTPVPPSGAPTGAPAQGELVVALPLR